MSKFTVEERIVSASIDNGEPVNVRWCTDGNAIAAASAVAMILDKHANPDPNALFPEQIRPRLLSITVTVT